MYTCTHMHCMLLSLMVGTGKVNTHVHTCMISCGPHVDGWMVQLVHLIVALAQKKRCGHILIACIVCGVVCTVSTD